MTAGRGIAHAELSRPNEAWQDRDTDRFGEMSAPIDRIDAPRPPWLRGNG